MYMNKFQDYIDAHLKEYPNCIFRENESMKEHTSFKIGGNAPVMFFPESEGEAAHLVKSAAAFGIRPIVIGNGTNLLVQDGELSAPVIQTVNGMKRVEVLDGGTVEAGCGATLASIASAAMKAGLSGLEFAHGIPGSLGGAVMMNAGAYGGEMKDVIVSVRVLCDDGEIELNTP